MQTKSKSKFNQGGYGVAGKFTPDTGVSAAKEKGNFKGLGYKGEAKEAPAETKSYGGFQESVDMSSGGDDDKSASASVTLDRIKKNQLAQTKFTPANFQDPLSGQFDQYKKTDPETYADLKFKADTVMPDDTTSEFTKAYRYQRLGYLGEPVYPKFENLSKRGQDFVKKYGMKSMTSQTLRERQEEVQLEELLKKIEGSKALEKLNFETNFDKKIENLPDVLRAIIATKKYYTAQITDSSPTTADMIFERPTFTVDWTSNLSDSKDNGRITPEGFLIAKFFAQAVKPLDYNPKAIDPAKEEFNWCSAFVDHILSLTGNPRIKADVDPVTKKVTNTGAAANSYKKYGTQVKGGLDNANSGDIVVFNFDEESDADHTSFLIGEEDYELFGIKPQANMVYVLGGNQSNQVQVSNYPKSTILDIRRIDKVTPKMINQLKQDNPQYKGFVESATPPAQRPKGFSLNPGVVEKTKEPMGRPKFNKGGTTMEQQMSLFEEGGMKDDGLDRDPVSGNDIPPGSLAKEVRDDIPAQLSDGEYVVPADVVQYFGVKFFEDIRAEAKRGLAEMEATGRIGGEPVEVDMTMIAFGQAKEEEEKKKKAQGGLMGYSNGGTPTVDDDYFKQQAIAKANPTAGFQRVGQSLFGQTQQGNVPMPGTILITKTFYHPDGRIQAVQGTMRGSPPAFVPNQGFDQFTKAPWSETPPAQTQATTKKQERDDSKDPQFTSTEFLSGSDQYKGLVDKDGKPVAVKILDSKGRVRVMTPEGYNAVVTSANRLGLDANTYYNLPFNTKRKLAGQELKSIFGGKVDDEKVEDILADSSKDGEGFFDQLFNGIVSGVKKIFGIEDTDSTPAPTPEPDKGKDDNNKKDNDQYELGKVEKTTSPLKRPNEIKTDIQKEADDFTAGQIKKFQSGQKVTGFKQGGLATKTKPKPKTRKPRGKGLGNKK